MQTDQKDVNQNLGIANKNEMQSMKNKKDLNQDLAIANENEM